MSKEGNLRLPPWAIKPSNKESAFIGENLIGRSRCFPLKVGPNGKCRNENGDAFLTKMYRLSLNYTYSQYCFIGK